MMDTIRYGLESPAFQYLTSLDLAVPTTYDVVQLARAINSTVREQLRSIRIAITDCTGPSGSSQYSCEEDNWDGEETSFEESGYLPSNWHAKHPNRKHQDEMFAFINSCRNLESLCLEATQYLDLDNANLKLATGLKVLSLSRFSTSTLSLIRLITAVTQRVLLYDIKIYESGGQWYEVFRHTRLNCPRLDYFQMYQLSYFHGHSSYEHNNRPWENYNVVWTDDRQDRKEMKSLLTGLGLFCD